ncbi:hypothetical protein PXNS11_250028 [Stutzerimonas xanthomarina]|nr:hypothetical protein PXNS11_250028 [Stutzerimonas xanthomarina]
MVFELRKHSKSLCVAFEVEKVRALRVAHIVEPSAPCGLLEPAANSILAGMAKRRIANVMGEAGRLDDHPEVGRAAPFGQVLAQHFPYAHAQGTADAADLKRVGQAGVDMVIAGNRMHLGLASEPPERAGKDDPVVVLVERTSTQFLCAVNGLSEPFTIK